MPKTERLKIEKNKYFVALGKVMARARASEALSTKDMAKILGIGDPYYRLMESGYACLHPTALLSLLASPVGKNFNYASFSTILSAINTLISKPGEEENCLEQLACMVPTLKALQNFKDDAIENGKILYDIISSPLELNITQFTHSVSNSIAIAIEDKVKEVIENNLELLREKK